MLSAARAQRLQEPQNESPPSNSEPEILPLETEIAEATEPENMEAVVRQARVTFGDTLPGGYLSEEEYKLYERLYGPPLRETRPEDVGVPTREFQQDIGEVEDEEEGEYFYDEDGDILLYRTKDGELQGASEGPVESEISDGAVESASQVETGFDELPSDPGLHHINAVAKNQREYNALLKLQKDFEKAALIAQKEMAYDEEEESFEEEEEEVEEEDEDEGEPDAEFMERADRVHEFSKLGHWRTTPTTIQLPKPDFVAPITTLLQRTDTKHIKEAAENIFGGAGLPFSVTTPSDKRKGGQVGLPMLATHHKMSQIDADVFMATTLPGMYASTMSILVEVRKRLGSDWMAKLMTRNNGEGPRILDMGGGGAGLAAWEQVLQAEWDIAREEGRTKKILLPPGKKTVVVGSETLRQRISRFLHNTTFLPRLPDYLHSGAHPDKLEGGEANLPRKQFDIIIASHTLLPIKEGYRRKAMIANLWEMLSPEGGILIIMEKGHPRGFEAVADVRANLLNEFIVSPSSDPRPEAIEVESRREREPGMIIAPCTNHKACPMYLTPGLSGGRKDFCHFSQRFIRPPFLQRLLGATHKNHDDVDFSFVAVQRGSLPDVDESALFDQGTEAADNAFKGFEKSSEAPDPFSLPRTVLPPIKRQGHVTFDMCTPAGKLERWTVPKSFSKTAYRDARKARWGDLWALGAKTRVVRPVRLGKGGPAPNDGGVRARRAAAANKPRKININADSGGAYSATESRRRDPERRKGKKGRPKTIMEELEIEGH
ncbi:Rsm22-domain-containing protein [Xylariaceae sp. FL1272]|nr:Rsm22-domain-containing protein [Xylariaceae sp. FL1272]